MTSLGRLRSYLSGSAAMKFWLAFIVLSVAALCVVGAVKSDSGSHDVEDLDAAGLDQKTESEVVKNKVNAAQLPDSSFIYDVTIGELANADSYMDGQIVQVTGEVVGDRIISEDDDSYCWIVLQALDKTDNELMVYMPMSLSETIDTYGMYGKRGTYLQVRGVFRLACADHQGSSELHAENVSIVSKGVVEQAEFDINKLIPGILLILVGSLLMFVFEMLCERQR